MRILAVILALFLMLPADVQSQQANIIRKRERHTLTYVLNPVRVCRNPYHKTWKILAFSGTLLTGMSLKDNGLFKESLLPYYYDTLALMGINAERNFVWFTDEIPGRRESYILDRDPDYFEHLHTRLRMVRERDLTEILCLTPYLGYISDDQLRRVIRETIIYSPNIIYECYNEPFENQKQERVVRILHEEGVPNSQIQINWINSLEYLDLLGDGLDGQGLAAKHNVGSMETIDDPANGWADVGDIEAGRYGCDDGGDSRNMSRGLQWSWLDGDEGRRPSNDQLFEIVKFMLLHTRGFDHLSAAGFQYTDAPDLISVMTLGIPEMAAMKKAWNEVIGKF